ncbi:transmembrane protein, putative (macronuclear) [Tetrahymena thermophila SB210]|uniref:Transmembrane protein, putative n=1 Tax=Tetrahymena thermophila (strain SB210) TaxID=312017 RepID=W7X7X4_TETTS|nr:transmembrane protein, putative [Tetrahymena thermophila SB210]EWS73437.1 transmembrane protein, putative [Tetrahymena thermophila SB210]|eukprot:XP_012654008.1 transmembrane protein, putative [Tetrahymena thermophila SB210]
MKGCYKCDQDLVKIPFFYVLLAKNLKYSVKTTMCDFKYIYNTNLIGTFQKLKKKQIINLFVYIMKQQKIINLKQKKNLKLNKKKKNKQLINKLIKRASYLVLNSFFQKILMSLSLLIPQISKKQKILIIPVLFIQQTKQFYIILNGNTNLLSITYRYFLIYIQLFQKLLKYFIIKKNSVCLTSYIYFVKMILNFLKHVQSQIYIFILIILITNINQITQALPRLLFLLQRYHKNFNPGSAIYILLLSKQLFLLQQELALSTHLCQKIFLFRNLSHQLNFFIFIMIKSINYISFQNKILKIFLLIQIQTQIQIYFYYQNILNRIYIFFINIIKLFLKSIQLRFQQFIQLLIYYLLIDLLLNNCFQFLSHTILIAFIIFTIVHQIIKYKFEFLNIQRTLFHKHLII